MQIEQISPTVSYFDLLGVPVASSDDELTRRYRDMSRRYHPDRFATADIETLNNAQDATALINDAYRTLRDPFGRAEYLLRRERGTQIGDLKQEATAPPQELFAVVLELQESLMEYQEAQMDGDDETVERLRPALLEAQTDFTTAYEKITADLRALFVRWDENDDRPQILDTISYLMGQRGYLRRVLGNLEKTLGQPPPLFLNSV